VTETESKPKQEDRALKVVSIGGGTGLSTLLRGLKHFVVPTGAHVPESDLHEPSLRPAIADLTAVVTVTDDGGSSGKLRKEFNILPPGDIRNCIVALSEDEALLARLFKYRFPAQSGLAGHNFGNLFLTALTAITGDFAEAVRLSAGVLVSRGHIYPATTANCELEALMDDGTRVRGETSITASKQRIRQLTMIPGDVKPMPQTLEAIRHADLITIGPGSLFTSLIPNVLVRGIPEAIAKSDAIKVFVCNLMTQANESLGLSAADHIRAIYEHAGLEVFDYALLNVKPASPEMKAKYALEGASQIVIQPETIEPMGVRPSFGDFLIEDRGVARHDTDRVAHELLQLAASQVIGATVHS